ncbi:OprD family porin [Pseudomonas sp. NMI542_15]|nr:OprD family outer membrane porin [Pseudomonas sp. NMI542_15]MCE0777565.1 OprD family porin [Pseudomonas sp. NMI542_15]
MKGFKGCAFLVMLGSGTVFGADDLGAVIDDSKLSVLLRNAVFDRDFKHGVQDRREWGQAAIAKFTSGYTPGLIGVSADVFGMYAVRLDGGGGRTGSSSIDMFKQDSSGNPADDLARGGAAINVKVSKTVIKYGDQMPDYPVLSYSNTRLLPETYTGVSLNSKDIAGFDLNAAHFTSEIRKGAEGHDSAGLNQIDLLGGTYSFSNNLQATAYRSWDKDFFEKTYGALFYTQPLSKISSLTLDLRGYHTALDNEFAARLGRGDENNIWSLAATYKLGGHSLILAHQRSSGSAGYPYGGYQSLGRPGDGGSTFLLANSFFSDFNAEDEVSWQIGYGYDFAAMGVPGLSYRFAYLKGENIYTPQGDGDERELFNQIKYVVQDGGLKDLSFKVRSSIVRVSRNAAAYNVSANEVRVYVEYPINIF